MAPLLAHPFRWEATRSFESVYRRHLRDVYAFSLHIVGNPDDAEDITQTTFLNAYRALNRGERVENMRAWLLAIAHNVCRQRFRNAARRPQEVELDADVADVVVDDDAPSAAEIRDAMRHLAFNQRTVLVLREIEGLSYEEIAEAMALSLSAVETLLFRARQALREQLEAADNDLGCDAVERLISLQLDGKLSRQDRRLLRAHLRSCDECAKFARSQRARKKVMGGLIAVPVPASLVGAFEPLGTGFVGAKVAAMAVAVLIGTGTLVGTGLVSPPGAGAGEEPTAVVAPARASEAREAVGRDILDWSQIESVSASAGVVAERAKAESKRVKRETRAKLGDAKAVTPPSVRTDEPTAEGGQESDSGTASGGGSASLPTVEEVVEEVEAVVSGAEDKLPPPPESPTLEPPSLPTVPLPGTDSLP